MLISCSLHGVQIMEPPVFQTTVDSSECRDKLTLVRVPDRDKNDRHADGKELQRRLQLEAEAKQLIMFSLPIFILKFVT